MRQITTVGSLDGVMHKLDYFGCYRDAPDTRTYRRWTTAEMVAECKRVIDQICERRSDADVAPVVRCKDCEYSYDEISYLCCSHGVCVDCEVPPNFYCAEGKRKEPDE